MRGYDDWKTTSPDDVQPEGHVCSAEVELVSEYNSDQVLVRCQVCYREWFEPRWEWVRELGPQ